jgi:hypothetical protein
MPRNSDMSSWLNGAAFKLDDERPTPQILVDAILPYIPNGVTVWCPFDLPHSRFVQSLKKTNKVIHSHLNDGKSFFDHLPKGNFDMVVSNPPFSLKLAVLERLYQLGKPFALVLPLTMLNYQEVGEFFIGKNLELLIPDKKVSFDGNTSSFNCSYFCSGVLPEKLMFCHLENNNSGRHFKSVGKSNA